MEGEVLHKPVITDDPFLWGKKKEDACKSKDYLSSPTKISQST